MNILRKYALVWMLACLAPVSALAAPVLIDPQIESATAPAASLEKQRDAYDALSRREFEKAKALFREAAALEPGSPHPWLGLAEVARTTGDEAGVEQFLQEAITRAPLDPKVLAAQGKWHYAYGDYDKAEEYWRTALKYDPQQARTLVDLGGLMLDVRREPDQAVKLFEQAIVIEPERASFHYALGMALWQASGAEAAVVEFEEAARLEPENPLPLYNLGLARAQVGQTAEALAAFDAALSAEDSYYPSRLAKADLLARDGDPEAALAEVNILLRSHPTLPAALLKVGLFEQMRGHVAEAMTAYQETLKYDPENLVALNNLAGLAAESPAVADRGLKWAQQAVTLAPDEPRYKDTLAWVLHKRGESAKALALLESQVQGPARSLPDSHYLLGVIYGDLGENAKSIAALREALRLGGDFANVADAAERLRTLETAN